MPVKKEMKFTLGWELEACRAAGEYDSEAINKGRDGSVSGDGVEYNSRPSLVGDNVKTLAALKGLVGDRFIRVDKTCGFHVHIGLASKTRLSGVWAGWMVTLARAVEEVAFQAVPQSRRNNSFCVPWSTRLESILKTRYVASKYSNNSRYQWLNVVEMFRSGGIRTIENRLLGSTRRYSYLSSWVAVNILMAKSAWKLIDDPSALPEEVEKMKQLFGRMVKFVYADEENPDLLRESVALMSEAGLSDTVPEPASEETQSIAFHDRLNLRGDIIYRFSEPSHVPIYTARALGVIGLSHSLHIHSCGRVTFVGECASCNDGRQAAISAEDERVYDAVLSMMEPEPVAVQG